MRDTRARCPSVQAALFYYRNQYTLWRVKMSAPVTWRVRKVKACPRYLMHLTVGKAQQAHRAYDRWYDYHWNWEEWLPDKWARIGACETGYGQRPGRWDWNSGMFQGAFGFYYGTWDAYRPAGSPSEAYLATPRQQYQAALNVYAQHGYGAWGCASA